MEKVRLKTKLNPQQLLFIKYYVQIGNAAEAVRKAGYKTQFPHKVGFRLLNTPKISQAIDNHRQVATQKTEITFEWKLNRLKEIALNSDNESDAIKAIEVMNKMQGDNAPEKHHNTNLNFNATLEELNQLSSKYLDELEQTRFTSIGEDQS